MLLYYGYNLKTFVKLQHPRTATHQHHPEDKQIHFLHNPVSQNPGMKTPTIPHEGTLSLCATQLTAEQSLLTCSEMSTEHKKGNFVRIIILDGQ